MTTITFYSYKGGVGRTLLLANTAFYLAHSGKTVFILDFDLEAPGLHFKLSLNYPDLLNKIRWGVVDYLHLRSCKLNRLQTSKIPDSLDSYVHVIPHVGGSNGRILFMPAGKAPSLPYARALSNVPWRDLFYGNHEINEAPRTCDQGGGGIALFRDLQRTIEAEYAPDFLLIDSRTGITDIGGVATRFLADKVVCLCLNNRENVAGIGLAIGQIAHGSPARNGGKIDIIPVLARIPETSLVEEERIVTDFREQIIKQAQGFCKATVRLPEITVLRSEPQVEILEKLLFLSDVSLRRSFLLRDYLQFFERLDKTVFDETRLSNVARFWPDRDQLLEWHSWSSRSTVTDTEVEDRVSTIKGRVLARGSLKLVRTKFVPGGETFFKLGEMLVDRLQETLCLQSRDVIDERKVNFDLLGIQMRQGVFDFCSEGYFLTRARSHSTSVVQFGYLKSFTAYLRKNTWIDEVIRSGGQALAFREVIDRIMAEARSRKTIVQVGLLGETAATSETLPHLTTRLKGEDLYIVSDHSELWKWLKQSFEAKNHKTRIIICDHGVAQRLHEEIEVDDLKVFPGVEFRSDWVFYFQERIPVGYLCSRQDEEWRGIISRALSDIVRYEMTREFWERVRENLLSVRVEAFSFKELCKYLILDMTLEEAMDWEEAVRKSIR